MRRSLKPGLIAWPIQPVPEPHGALPTDGVCEERYRFDLEDQRARHGRDARTRYGALLLAAMRRVAENPEGGATSDRGELRPGIRSFHIRHSRHESREAPVANPVHVLFYRVVQTSVVEIVRVLHERMEPARHIGP
jgi:toxin ParE1/3/4